MLSLRRIFIIGALAVGLMSVGTPTPGWAKSVGGGGGPIASPDFGNMALTTQATRQPELYETIFEIYATELFIILGEIKSLLTPGSAGQIEFIGERLDIWTLESIGILPDADSLPDEYRAFSAWAPTWLKVLALPRIAE